MNFQLKGLDIALQNLLASLTQECHDLRGVFCEPIAIVLRTLYILHGHILTQCAEKTNDSAPHWLQESVKFSHAALRTAAKIVVDIVETHENMEPYTFVSRAPSYYWLIRAALNHIHTELNWRADDWFPGAEAKLSAALDQLSKL